MSKQPLKDFFKKSQLLSQKAINIMAEEYEERHFVKDEFFLKQGKVSDSVFLIEGLMRAYTFTPKGNEVTTNFFSQYQAVYDPASFFQQTPSMENIQAVTECLTYSISYDKVNKLFHTIPEFREFGRLMLLEELVSFKQRTLAVINRSAEERYVDLMKEHQDILQNAPLKHIASYLGITDSSLSRIRRNSLRK
ncbi:MAG TPA: Crp/Fnr family transcriptional regulator [Chitinophagaceae bacterium]|jgi:CRP-like cAMP-binding protein|nr:Crp/Fnr family transcriptional regulator [Chitinophagaceae bacterium]